jgi:hypothetical protein
MPEPTVEVLGVYRVRATDELIRDRVEYSYPRDRVATKEGRAVAENESREFLESIALVEGLIHNRDDRFNIGDFTQRVVGLDRKNWQAAYAEAFLTPDGEALAAKRWTSEIPPGDLRVAFFLHFWDSATPLTTSYGDIRCPPVTAMPARLERLVPYENVG